MLPPAQYLSKIKPFSFLSEGEMSELISSMDVFLYRKGRKIFESGKRIKKFYFIREGKVGLFCNSDLVGTVEKDEILEIDASLSTATTEYTARALEDSIIFEFDITRFQKILQKNLIFKEFVEKLISCKFLTLLKLTETSDSGTYDRPVSMIINKSPIFCFKDKTLRETVELMNKNEVGSVIVVDPEMRPMGILTHSDVLRSIEKELPLTESVERAMSYPVITINSKDSILEAYFKFLSHGINHLAVVDDGKLIGVVSIKDLIYNLENRSHFFKITKEIIRSKDLEELKKLSLRIDSLIKNVSAYGLNYPSISRLVATIVDAVLRKALSKYEPVLEVAIMLVGEYGRREFDVPLTIDLLVFGDKKSEGDLLNYAESLSNAGLQIGKVKMCFEDVHEFLNIIPFTDLLEILDARYIFGDRITYIKFKNAFKALFKQNKFLVNLKSFFEETAIKPDGIVPLISNGIKVMSHLYGDSVSRPTWERIKILESRGIISKELAERLSEAYITLRAVELNSKLNNKKELLDKIVYKRIIKIVVEYKLWMKNMLG